MKVLNAGHTRSCCGLAASASCPGADRRWGIVLEAWFAEQRIELQRGETLVVYTDGVTEAMNETGDFFGEERLRRLLADPGRRGAEPLAGRSIEAVGAFVAHSFTTTCCSPWCGARHEGRSGMPFDRRRSELRPEGPRPVPRSRGTWCAARGLGRLFRSCRTDARRGRGE